MALNRLRGGYSRRRSEAVRSTPRRLVNTAAVTEGRMRQRHSESLPQEMIEWLIVGMPIVTKLILKQLLTSDKAALHL
jgi:hypothetical protein